MFAFRHAPPFLILALSPMLLARGADVPPIQGVVISAQTNQGIGDIWVQAIRTSDHFPLGSCKTSDVGAYFITLDPKSDPGVSFRLLFQDVRKNVPYDKQLALDVVERLDAKKRNHILNKVLIPHGTKPPSREVAAAEARAWECLIASALTQAGQLPEEIANDLKEFGERTKGIAGFETSSYLEESLSKLERNRTLAATSSKSTAAGHVLTKSDRGILATWHFTNGAFVKDAEVSETTAAPIFALTHVESGFLFAESAAQTGKIVSLGNHGALLNVFEWPHGPIKAMTSTPDGKMSFAAGESGKLGVGSNRGWRANDQLFPRNQGSHPSTRRLQGWRPFGRNQPQRGLPRVEHED